MQNVTNPTVKTHVVWLDVVRLIAMFTVVCCHCTDPFNFYPGDSPIIGDIKFWGAAYGAFLRPCVPLFVMITGALLLPVREETSIFYKKRILRVFWPFLIWSVIYKIPFNFSLLDVHMWYIYLLIGLYLYLPIFSAWVEKVSDKAKLWFLAGWGVTLFIPYYREFVSPYIWGGCSWNEFSMLYYFAGFNGYLLLGHYLRNHDWSLGKIVGIGIPMFVVGYAITFFGFRYTTALPAYTEEQLELFFYYCSPNVVMMTIPIFLLAKKVNVKSDTIKRMLANLTICGFGIYMVHYFFTGPSVLLARALNIPLGLQIPAASVVSFAVSWLIVLGIRKICGKKAKYIVG